MVVNVDTNCCDCANYKFFFHGVLITTQAARCPLRLLDHRHPQVGGALLRFPEKLITKKEVYRTTLVKQS